jgi:hypothetical protein
MREEERRDEERRSSKTTPRTYELLLKSFIQSFIQTTLLVYPPKVETTSITKTKTKTARNQFTTK